MLTNLTAKEIRSIFTYNKTVGLLKWRINAGRHGRIEAGTIAGALNKDGYRYIRVDGVNYRASRLVWLYVTGEWPEHQIDHKDRDTSNDKWTNLRQATGSQNKANCGKYKTRKQSCNLKGVQAVQKRHSIRYRAIATKDGVRHHLGYFDTPELAHAAYLKASDALHGEFASSGMEPT